MDMWNLEGIERALRENFNETELKALATDLLIFSVGYRYFSKNSIAADMAQQLVRYNRVDDLVKYLKLQHPEVNTDSFKLSSPASPDFIYGSFSASSRIQYKPLAVSRKKTDTKRTTVFVSYSHEDRRWLKRLQVHLKPLQREFTVVVWDDTKLRGGDKWLEEIERAIASAKVAILLVSADFLGSDFIVNNELPPLLEKAKAKGLTILSIIVKPCRFMETESLAQFQAINDPTCPLSNMTTSQREEIFVRVTKEVEVLLKESQTV